MHVSGIGAKRGGTREQCTQNLFELAEIFRKIIKGSVSQCQCERDSHIYFKTKPVFISQYECDFVWEGMPNVFPGHTFLFKPMWVHIESGLVWKYIGLSLSLDIDSPSLSWYLKSLNTNINLAKNDEFFFPLFSRIGIILVWSLTDFSLQRH